MEELMELGAGMAKLILTVSAGHVNTLLVPAAYFRDSGCSLERVMGEKSKENLKRNDASKSTPKEELRGRKIKM